MNSHKISCLFKKHGGKIIVKDSTKKHTGFGFIQPLRYKNKIYLGDKYVEAGACGSDYFLLVSDLNTRLLEFDNNADIIFLNKHYGLKTAEVYYKGDSPLYIWAIIFQVDDLT